MDNYCKSLADEYRHLMTDIIIDIILYIMQMYNYFDMMW